MHSALNETSGSFHVSWLSRGGKKSIRAIGFSEPGVWRDQPSIHAEMNTIRRCGNNLNVSKWTLFSMKLSIGKGGVKLRMARPCIHCTKRIAQRGFKKIVYSTPEGLQRVHIDELLNVATASSGNRRRHGDSMSCSHQHSTRL